MIDCLTPTLTILERLVGFATVSDQSNRDLVGYVSDYLAGYGVKAHVFHDDSGEKFGLIAQIGPDIPGGVILSGHTDVVPVANQPWTTDPWTLTERDGRIYGRGTCDMKGFLALALAAVPDMLAASLKRPIQLAFSYDEEIGCLGSAPTLAALASHFPKAQSVIVGEPTQWRVVSGHKGGIGLRTEIIGKAAHSSMPDLGVSSIAFATRLIDWHGEMMKHCKATANDTGFDPPHSTFQVGTILGGSAVNIVPDHCQFESDIRFVPPEAAQDWIAAYTQVALATQSQMQSHHPEARITVTATEHIPALHPEKDGAAEQIVRRLTGDNSDNRVSYQTEAGYFQSEGYSTIVCGPGSIAQAHQADEFVTRDQLQRGQDFMAHLIADCAAD